MILISSGAYVEQDLSYEVGRIPPSFLPLGNKRLYEHQVSFLSTLAQDIYISLPESFEIPIFDKLKLEQLNVNVIHVPDNLSLGDSVMFSWTAAGLPLESLTILHGDTLFIDFLLSGCDFISVHKNVGSYRRGIVAFGSKKHFSSDFVSGKELVISGVFSFLHPHKLMQGILKSKGDFIEGVEYYAAIYSLEERHDGLWLDFGHLHSFFRSRSLMTTQRAFNNLKIEPRTVTKSSNNASKIAAESNWFSNIPDSLRLHTPALISKYCITDDTPSYTTEYLYNLPLSDLLVYGDLSNSAWHSILSVAKEVSFDFSKYNKIDIDVDSLNLLYLEKTLQRVNDIKSTDFQYALHEFETQEGITLYDIALITSRFIRRPEPSDVGVVHGDFCFSNILYDSRTHGLKLLDPRGLNSKGENCIYGDIRYDIAKLYHSVVGCYDYIIASRYKIEDDNCLNFYDNKLSVLENYFDEIFFFSKDFNKIEILAINVHLFISMLPLHYDRPDRQKAMLLNSYRLYKKLMELAL
ncbi:hypothetical protein U0O11_10730 [Cobetia sp. D5]|uniref:hypothetical protein n=1 Tax=Cobetia sp. D5 TaxID=3105867 RepID=UPI002D78A529|nr:hypothetical protein [Cobetia sp. D5]